MKKTAVILINIGSPERAVRKDVRKYLFQFLNDPYVIDLPWIMRKILVNLIIIPFRTAKSTLLYKKIWTDQGSPLIVNTHKLVEKLNKMSQDNFRFYAGMRYGKPSIAQVIDKVKEERFDQLIIFPLFPQFATSTSSTAIEKALAVVREWDPAFPVKLIRHFHDEPSFIGAFAEKIKSYEPALYDHVLFSFHGLPNRHINKIHPEKNVDQCVCERSMPSWGKYCYKAACYETARRIAKESGIKEMHYSVAFQSRLSKNWLTPFTEDCIIAYAEKGLKKVLVVAPSFVSDCLETIYEIGDEYNEVFKTHGGKQLTLVESLNDDDAWVTSILKIVDQQGFAGEK
jgi:ferrochelatase